MTDSDVWKQVTAKTNVYTGQDPCKIWSGALRGNNPVMRIEGRITDLRRWIYSRYTGALLKSTITVQTRCGNDRCLAPEHMVAGTWRKGRPCKDAEQRIKDGTMLLATGCIVWLGALNNGYPIMSVKGKNTNLRSWRYARARRLVPEGFTVVMTCRNKRCLNVEHMRLW